MDIEELEQPQLVYILNLKDGLQKDGPKLYDEEGPYKKKPAAENMLIEKPTLCYLSHVYNLYKESGSDNDYIEDSLKGKKKKNLKEDDYTNMDKKKAGKQADLLNKEKTMISSRYSKKNGENEKALVTKEIALSNLVKKLFIDDSAAPVT